MQIKQRVLRSLAGAIAAGIVLPASAASISASVSRSVLGIGESSTVELFLNLEAGETASVLEGVFGISGLGTVASGAITQTGPTWPNAASNILGGEALVSLTSDNDGAAQRSIATLSFTALSAGTLALSFDGRTFAAFDTAAFPFSQNLALSNAPGDLLASISVVPEPSALTLLAVGASVLLMTRRGWRS